MENKTLHGTTTVGVLCSDGVVFGADKRASMGYFVASRDVDKIHQIDDRAAVTIAGMTADAQALVRLMKAEISLYKTRTGMPLSVNAATSLMANIMHSYKFFPFLVQILIGGLDQQPRIYSLDPIGAMTEETFVSTGSGSPVAYGVLEDSYREDKPIKDNLKLVLRALSVAMKRDCATGDGMDLVAISKDEFKKYTKAEIKKILE
ncbi:archaeal proteasome endopeptidase complex subunit beta [Candidatus Micrarchaeota archaeon]|nr:archaeal proteasome endopeptidase complex subunit beta [Candidatus Micrarchaeota archaeon]